MLRPGAVTFRFRRFALQQVSDGLRVCTDSIAFGSYALRDPFLRRAGRPPSLANANDFVEFTVRPGFEAEGSAPVDWVPRSVLDIGAGCGLLSMMAAQRVLEERVPGLGPVRPEDVRRRANGPSGAFIHAIEANRDAAECARLNFASSPWAQNFEVFGIPFQHFWRKFKGLPLRDTHMVDPVKANDWLRRKYHDDVPKFRETPMPASLLGGSKEFERELRERGGADIGPDGIGALRLKSYDLIISNPPFHGPCPNRNHSEGRLMAMSQDYLPFAEILEGADALLAPTGQLWMQFPDLLADELSHLAARWDLHVAHRARVRFVEQGVFNRAFVCFVRGTRSRNGRLFDPKCVWSPFSSRVQVAEWLYRQGPYDEPRIQTAIDSVLANRASEKGADGSSFDFGDVVEGMGADDARAAGDKGDGGESVDADSKARRKSGPTRKADANREHDAGDACSGKDVEHAAPGVGGEGALAALRAGKLPVKVFVDVPMLIPKRREPPPSKARVRPVRGVPPNAPPQPSPPPTDPQDSATHIRPIIHEWFRAQYFPLVLRAVVGMRAPGEWVDPRTTVVYPPAREELAVQDNGMRITMRFLRLCSDFYRVDLMQPQKMPLALVLPDGRNAVAVACGTAPAAKTDRASEEEGADAIPVGA